MKITKLLQAALVLSAIPLTASATDYSYTLGATPNAWNTVSWVPSGTPTTGDNVTMTTNDGTQRYFYVAGTRTVANFTRDLSVGSGNLLLSNSSDGTDSSLTITDTLTTSGSLQLRSGNGGASPGKLTVNTGDFVMTGGARVAVAASTNYRFVELAVSGTTTLQNGNTNFEIGASADSNTSIDLGDVFFASNLSGGSPGININSGTLRVRSLATQNTASNNPGGIQSSSAGVLEIYGTSGTHVFTSPITGSITLKKTGGNTQVLAYSGANSYTGGTEVSGGVLSVQNTTATSALGSGAVTVKNLGTLGGSGYVMLGVNNYTTVESGGVLAPGVRGNGTFESLTLNNYHNRDNSTLLLDMENGSAFSFELDAAGNSDLLNLYYYTIGDLVLGSSGIAVNVSGTLAEGVTYELFNFRISGSLSELTSSGLTEGLVAGTGFSGYEATFHYDEVGFGGTGVISMTVEVVPEPSTALLVLLPLAGLAFRRRNRHRH